MKLYDMHDAVMHEPYIVHTHWYASFCDLVCETLWREGLKVVCEEETNVYTNTFMCMVVNGINSSVYT